MALSLYGFDTAREVLRGISARAADPTPVLLDVADELRELNARRFSSTGYGKRWEPLSEEYALRKARDGKGSTAGRYSGELLASLTRPGSRYSHERVTSDYVEVTTRAPHARLYDEGRGGQPARDLNRVRPADAARLRLRVARYVLTGRR